VEDLALVVDLVLAVGAALVGGVVAQRLGQPTIVGYLVGGVLIGPFTPGPVADVHNIQVLAEIGVAFLMFALGAEFSFAELRRLGRVAGIGGAVQIVGTTLLGPVIAPALGLTLAQGVFLGALLALSSTVVALKVLMGRGELQALHGRAALGILIAQDLAVVPMVVVLPGLAGGGFGGLAPLGWAVLKAAAILAGAYAVGARLAPWVLERAALARSRELFVVGVVAFALGTALATQLAGLSLAFGAFLAGLVVAESEFRAQVLAEVLPLRDLFVSLFFVSVGMLVNPAALAGNLGAAALLGAAVVVGKVVIVTAVVLALALPGRAALLTGLSLAQIGEFSFVLARLGSDAGAVPPRLFDLVLVTAVATIVLTPFLLRAEPLLLAGLRAVPPLARRFAEPAEADPEAEPLRRHAVICGYGRVGRELAAALDARGLRYAVVEYNPLVVRELRDRRVPVVYGDASNPAVLEHAHLGRARLLAVLVPDAHTAELATRWARTHHPRLDVVARAADAAGVERLERAGASAVVPLASLARHRVVHLTVGGHHLVVRYRGTVSSALDAGDIPLGRPVGTAEVRENGRLVPFDQPFWFAVAAFRPRVVLR
jgi:CPA2 family monovalent cation:H+ antiporter-2